MTYHQQALIQFMAFMATFAFVALSVRALWPRIKREMKWHEVDRK